MVTQCSRLPTVRRATADQYEYILRLHIVPHLGDRELGTFTPADVQVWLGMMHRRSGLAPNTVAKVYRLLKNMLGGAVKVGMIARNACTIRGAGTQRPPEIVAAYGSLRWGELGGLQRRHVNLGTGVVLVEQKLCEVNGVLEIDAPKTDTGRRSVALPALAVDELERHLRSNVEPLATSLVFAAAEGGYLRRTNLRRRVWVPATEAVGVPGFRFHDLRHTGATLAAATGDAPRRR